MEITYIVIFTHSLLGWYYANSYQQPPTITNYHQQPMCEFSPEMHLLYRFYIRSNLVPFPDQYGVRYLWSKFDFIDRSQKYAHLPIPLVLLL